MKNKNRGRRGMTVSELMVVLAVLTIVIVMVVSFSTMVGSTSKLAKAKLDALNDIRLAESVIEGFIEENGNSLDHLDHTSLGNENNRAKFESDGNLHIYYGDPNRQNLSLKLENVKSITFDTIGETDKIYYCTITYEIGGSDFNYTFCVNPYAGEKIGGNS